MSRRMPTYFLSIGGPQFLSNPTHPAAARLAAVGKEITTVVKPRAVVVFSAHWSDERPTGISVNVANKTDLIYDFGGFPSWYYTVEYPNRGSAEVAEKVISKLEAGGVKVNRVQRGLDHGVWVGFLSAFDPKTNPLNVPIVQVSLHGKEDLELHYRLGEVLAGLREEEILIIGAGMASHNLMDFRRSFGSNKAMPYAASFDNRLMQAATARPAERKEKMLALMEHRDAQQAHPTLEHLLPVFIAAGAAGEDAGERLWTFPENSLNWAQYRFGKTSGSA